MTRNTKNNSTSDEAHSFQSQLEHQVDGISTVVQVLSTRIGDTESQVEQLNTHFTQFSAQFSFVPETLLQLSVQMEKLQSSFYPIPPTTQSTTSRPEHTVPVQNLPPYHHSNSRTNDTPRHLSFFQDHPDIHLSVGHHLALNYLILTVPI
jgi:hypothetical protein